MIVKSMMGTFSWDELKHCGQLVVVSIALWAITFGLAQLVYRLMGKTPSARIMRFSMTYTNFTFVGIPVIESLYGSTGVFYFVVFVVPYRMVYYSSAEPLLTPPGLARKKRTLKDKLKGWFSVPVVAVFVGLILYLTQLQLPAPWPVSSTPSDPVPPLWACCFAVCRWVNIPSAACSSPGTSGFRWYEICFCPP